jgi:Zn-dependent protease
MLDTLIFLFILFFSVIIHEVSHGYAALKNGDPTSKYMGRLTLNPIPHIDPIGTILLPVLLIIFHSPILIGIAKPVPINPLNFRNYKKGMVIVGLSGAMSNIFLGIIFAFLCKITNSINLIAVLKMGSIINFILAFFNLIPIPPLDGSRVISVFLPYRLKTKYESIERYGIFLIIFLAMIKFLDWLLPLSENLTNFFIHL